MADTHFQTTTPKQKRNSALGSTEAARHNKTQTLTQNAAQCHVFDLKCLFSSFEKQIANIFRACETAVESDGKEGN